MMPVLERGLTFWDRALLPRDEYEQRLTGIQQALRQRGIAALIVLERTHFTSGRMAYLAGCCLGGALLARADGAPTLYTVGAERELSHNRTLTWIEDVRADAGGRGCVVAQGLRKSGIERGTLAVVGMDLLTDGSFGEFTGSLKEFQLVDFDEEYWQLRSNRRPREILAIQSSLQIASHAVNAAQAAHAAGASNAEAVVEAERIARYRGARDLRILANLRRDGTMTAFEGREHGRHERLLLILGVDRAFQSASAANPSAASSGGAAMAAVSAMTRAARPGRTVDSIVQAGISQLNPAMARTALAFGLGVECGTSFLDSRPLEIGSDRRVSEGAVLCLHVHASTAQHGELACSTIRVGRDSTDELRPL